MRCELLLQSRELFRHGFDSRFGVGDIQARINHVSLAALFQLGSNELMDLRQLLVAADESPNAAPVRGHLIDDGGIQITVERQTERARDGRRGHHKQVRVAPLPQELLPLRHAELVLLIDDDETQIRHVEGRCDERVGADEKLRVECRG